MTATMRDAPVTPAREEPALCVPLAEAFDERRTGGKAATLARLIALGIPVPDGVVLTTGAFDAFLGGIQEPQATVMTAPLPPGISSAIDGAAATLGNGPFAVRSSAVGEDGAGSSFAGQFDSVLHVDAASVGEAVRTCWASTWSSRALFYRQSRGLAPAPMAVLIQRQVPARVSGVLFTRNPDPAAMESSEMIVEYCDGLADRLVAGEVNPGRMYVSRTTLAVTREDTDDDQQAGRAALPAMAIRELARLALVIERAAGAPQDIEWAIGADARLAIVQARPITTLDRHVGAAVRRPDPDVLWSNANVSENFPDPISPLLYSIASAGYYHYFRNLGLAFGVSRRRLTAMDCALRAIVGVHGARLYYNLTSIHSVLRMAPFGERLAGAFNLFVGVRETASQPATAVSWSDRRSRMRQILEVVRIAAGVTWQFLWLGGRLRSFERAADAFAARTTAGALERRSLSALGDDLAAFIDIRCHRWKNASLCDTAAMVCYALLRWELARRGFGDSWHTRLLRALPDVPSVQPAIRLWALSRLVQGNPELASLVAGQPGAALSAIRSDPRFAGFRSELDAFLSSWGFRSSGELMLTTPTLEEEPEPVLALLAQYVAAGGESPDDALARQAAERHAETRSVLRTVARRAPAHAAAIWILLRWTQRAVAYRERARLKQALLYTRCRRVALRIGDELATAGRLPDRDSVFMLTWQEIDELCAGRSMFPRSAAALVAMRREAHSAESALAPPDTLRLAESAPFEPGTVPLPAANDSHATDPTSELRGTTACGGRVSAPAAVLAGIHESHKLARGNVLVTRQTDPGWGPVFCLISGLVIERGGMLSHGAIIAREFGLPCIVGVAGATTRIPHGARLTLDANRSTCVVEAA